MSKTKVHSLIDQHQKFTHETSKILANILNSKRTLDEILECNQSKFRWLKKVAEKNLRNSIVFESHFQEFSVGLKEKIALLDHVDDFLKEDLNSCKTCTLFLFEIILRISIFICFQVSLSKIGFPLN